jgi:UDP-GlcNAc:undecaprenyl-phosphate GlcNAc-1-phosphate transferase
VELGLALIVALVATPLSARLARRWEIVDRPGPLKTHTTPVPYLGGVAVFAGMAVGLVAVGRTGLVLPLGVVFVLGLLDDVRPLSPRVRLTVEIVAGILAAVVVPGPILVRLGTGALLVVMLNAVNLLDGQDGIVAAVAGVAALGLAVLGGDAQPLGLALAGGLGGFLVFNWPPASVYLGDAGAYLVGAALALLVPLTRDGTTSWSLWFATPLLLAVPVLDTAVAIGRRLRLHRPLFAGDRSHVYDQLRDRGLSVVATTIAAAVLQVVLSVLGVIGAGLSPVASVATTLAVAAAAGLLAWRAGFLTG